ncbi:MAG: type II toxin-antitoxin system VapC family toxin [Chloroflexi bacterium]|nr:type II toxin-antitoxin system VapC family toxin [Chloroflexota bacterium]
MNLYLDTSSLIKQYLQEPGTDMVKRLVAEASSVATSLVSYVEARSALARGQRAGRLNAPEHARAVAGFETDWRRYTTIDLAPHLVQLAGDLAAKHYLRGLDAIHLASALTLRDSLGEPVTFSAGDERLMAAAAAEGLAIP